MREGPVEVRFSITWRTTALSYRSLLNAADLSQLPRPRTRSAGGLSPVEQAKRAGATTLREIAEALATCGLLTLSERHGAAWRPIQAPRVLGRYPSRSVSRTNAADEPAGGAS